VYGSERGRSRFVAATRRVGFFAAWGAWVGVGFLLGFMLGFLLTRAGAFS
jgi:hypothetical protein